MSPVPFAAAQQRRIATVVEHDWNAGRRTPLNALLPLALAAAGIRWTNRPETLSPAKREQLAQALATFGQCAARVWARRTTENALERLRSLQTMERT